MFKFNYAFLFPAVLGTCVRNKEKKKESTLYCRQHSFMYTLCSKQHCLLCAYEFGFGDKDIITIV
jgi:hypothetical protein